MMYMDVNLGRAVRSDTGPETASCRIGLLIATIQ